MSIDENPLFDGLDLTLRSKLAKMLITCGMAFGHMNALPDSFRFTGAI